MEIPQGIRPQEDFRLMGPARYGNGPRQTISYEGLFPSTEEMQKAWNFFWSQNRLSIDEHGRKYRTNEPRVMPASREFEFKNKRRRHG